MQFGQKSVLTLGLEILNLHFFINIFLWAIIVIQCEVFKDRNYIILPSFCSTKQSLLGSCFMIGSSDYTNNPSPQLSPIWFSLPQASMTTSLQKSEDVLQNPVQQDKHSSIFPGNNYPRSHLFSPALSIPKSWTPRELHKWTLISKEKGVSVSGKTGTSSLWASHFVNNHSALQNYSGSHLKAWVSLGSCQNFLLIYRWSLGWLCIWNRLFRLDT